MIEFNPDTQVIVDKSELLMWFSELSYLSGFIGVIAPDKYEKVNDLAKAIREKLNG